MGLVDDLIASVETRDAQVRDITVGASWIMVASSACGISPGGAHMRQQRDRFADRLCGKPAAHLLDLVSSADRLERSVGVATLNSLILGQTDFRTFRPYRLPRARGKTIAVVGEIPVPEGLKDVAAEVLTIARQPTADAYDGGSAAESLARADVAMIDGSLITDHTLGHLLDLAKSCYTIVYGPATVLSPVLFRYGADQLSGVRVTDEDSVRRWISEDTGPLLQCPGITPAVMVTPQQSR